MVALFVFRFGLDPKLLYESQELWLVGVASNVSNGLWLYTQGDMHSDSQPKFCVSTKSCIFLVEI